MPKKATRASVEATMAAILAVPKSEIDAMEEARPKGRPLSKKPKAKPRRGRVRVETPRASGQTDRAGLGTVPPTSEPRLRPGRKPGL